MHVDIELLYFSCLFFFFFSVVLVINYFLPCTASDIRTRENTEMGQDGKELG